MHFNVFRTQRDATFCLYAVSLCLFLLLPLIMMFTLQMMEMTQSAGPDIATAIKQHHYGRAWKCFAHSRNMQLRVFLHYITDDALIMMHGPVKARCTRGSTYEGVPFCRSFCGRAAGGHERLSLSLSLSLSLPLSRLASAVSQQQPGSSSSQSSAAERRQAARAHADRYRKPGGFYLESKSTLSSGEFLTVTFTVGLFSQAYPGWLYWRGRDSHFKLNCSKKFCISFILFYFIFC